MALVREFVGNFIRKDRSIIPNHRCSLLLFSLSMSQVRKLVGLSARVFEAL